MQVMCTNFIETKAISTKL